MIEGIKFTGDFKVKEKIQQDVFEALSRIDGTRTKEELRNVLSQINYQEYKYRRPVFSGTAGLAHPLTNSIYVNSEFIDYKQGKYPLEIIVHEIIHKLQKSNVFYRGKEVFSNNNRGTSKTILRRIKKNREQ